jgi:hypothetical protein
MDQPRRHTRAGPSGTLSLGGFSAVRPHSQLGSQGGDGRTPESARVPRLRVLARTPLRSIDRRVPSHPPVAFPGPGHRRKFGRPSMHEPFSSLGRFLAAHVRALHARCIFSLFSFFLFQRFFFLQTRKYARALHRKRKKKIILKDILTQITIITPSLSFPFLHYNSNILGVLFDIFWCFVYLH